MSRTRVPTAALTRRAVLLGGSGSLLACGRSDRERRGCITTWPAPVWR